LTLVPQTLALAGGSANDEVFPPGSEPFGVSYQESFGDHMIWLQEIPTPANPFVDPTGPRNCERRGRFVYIAGFEANCRVPEGKAIAFSGPFWECSTAEGLGDTFRELRRCAVDNFARDLARDVFGITVRIDGDRVLHPRRWVFVTPGEIVVFPDDNIWGAPGGPSKSVTKGFYFIVRPLDEGRHQIRIHVNDAVFGEFNVTYSVRVVD
jgi:hypothetical protein